MSKTYRLLGSDGKTYESSAPGELGGNRKARIYGRLDCSAVNAALAKGYTAHRVFFADETVAITAGYRPCGRCLRERYSLWKAGGSAGSTAYPWLQLPA
jgi:hypothetical protein